MHCAENGKPVISSFHWAPLQSTHNFRKVVDQVGGQQSQDLLDMYQFFTRSLPPPSKSSTGGEENEYCFLCDVS